jgi:hypothetical protein
VLKISDRIKTLYSNPVLAGIPGKVPKIFFGR